MKKTSLIAIALVLGTAGVAMGRDAFLQLSIESALNSVNVKSELFPEIKLYWGDQSYPEPKTVFGEYKTSQRTNAVGKSKEEACQWALAAALKQLQERALKEGGNAVINIKSNIKNRERSSETEYDCLAGSMMVNAALKGTVVKIEE